MVIIMRVVEKLEKEKMWEENEIEIWRLLRTVGRAAGPSGQTALFGWVGPGVGQDSRARRKRVRGSEQRRASQHHHPHW